MSAVRTPQVVDSEEFIPLLDYSFTGDTTTVENKVKFINAYREEGSVYHAAQAARIHRATVYKWIESDEEFAQAVEDSKEDCYDKAESSVYRKALAGDSLLLMFYLKAHRHKFRDKVTIDVESLREEIQERIKQVSGSVANPANPMQFLAPSDNQQKEDGGDEG
jgi:hypothetical protein